MAEARKKGFATRAIHEGYAAMGASGRARLGITDGLMRVSVRIEDVEDIVADLMQALDG